VSLLSLKQALTELVTKHTLESEKGEFFRAPLIGFSSAADPLYDQLKEIIGAWHLHPQDILPEAKTVISFFLPFSIETVYQNQQHEPAARAWAESYVAANQLIGHISEQLIEFLASKGIMAATLPATHSYDAEKLQSAWSHRSAAYIAGLGRFGVNRMLITPVGCAGRYGTVITAAELPADVRSEQEYCRYHQNGSCLACIRACPVGALRVDGFDKFRCNDRLLKNATQFSDIGFCDVCGKCVVAGPCAVMAEK
jgi:epoxyqueuosine reductase